MENGLTVVSKRAQLNPVKAPLLNFSLQNNLYPWQEIQTSLKIMATECHPSPTTQALSLRGQPLVIRDGPFSLSDYFTPSPQSLLPRQECYSRRTHLGTLGKAGGLQAAMYFLGAKGDASEGFNAIAIEHDWPPTDHPSETGVDLKKALFSISTVTIVLCHKND